jgi:predicted dehydrogenase
MTHKVGIIGLGGAGLGHLRYWPAAGAVVSGICDVQPDLVARRAREFTLERSCQATDVHDFLQRCDCDIVAICTPDHLHAEHATAALQSGRHVHLEKPVVQEDRELRDLLACAAERPHLLVGLHYQLRYFWLYRRIKELIARGDFGEVYGVEADYLHNIKIRTIGTSDWRERSATVQPVFAGAGGTHFVDLMRWFVDDEVDEVVAYGNQGGWTDYPAATHVTAMLRFRRGAVGKITVSIGSTLPKQHPTRVFGSKACSDDLFLFRDPHVARPEWLGTRLGALSRGRLRGPLTEALTFLLRAIPVRLERFPFSSYEHVESCVATVRNFVNALDGKEPLEGSLVEGARTFEACRAVERSLASGKPEKVPDVTRERIPA